MSDDKVKILFLGDKYLKDFTGNLSVRVSSIELSLLYNLDYVVFCKSAVGGVQFYLIIAKVTDVLLSDVIGEFVVRASDARRITFDVHDASEAERTRYWSVKESYDKIMPQYQIDKQVSEVTSDLLFFETGEKIVMPNGLFNDQLSLQAATKLLAKSYGVSERQVSIRILN